MKRTEDTSSEWSPSFSESLPRRDGGSRLAHDPQTTRDHDLPTRHKGTRLDREFVAADPRDDAAPTDPAATATAPGADHGPGRADPTFEWATASRARGSASRGTAGGGERSTSPSLSFRLVASLVYNPISSSSLEESFISFGCTSSRLFAVSCNLLLFGVE